jgi:aspartyl/asparaginyl-tRNA synthetase
MNKRIVIALLIGLSILAGGWYAFHVWKGTPIASILKDPRQYDGQVVTIRGKVVDRTSLVLLRYFTLRDDTGEIRVVTDRSLPLVGETVRVKGTVREEFAIGDSQFVVLVEEPLGSR